MGAALLCGALSPGCFFELPELQDEFEGIGGVAGSVGSSPAGFGGGIMAAGGSIGGGGNGGVSPCPLGQKDCGAGCVAFARENGCGDPSCTPCAVPPQATVSCNGDTNLCQVSGCDLGFADCDGLSNNGCEYSFAPGNVLVPVAPELIEVPLVTSIDIGDESRDDWAGVPAYPLLATCVEENCVDDALPPVIAKNEVPLRSDLEAYFRVAWDQDFFYVLGDVFDGALVDTGDQTGEGICQNGALCEDAFTLFFDGRNNRSVSSGYSIDDSRVFLGLGGKAYRVSGAPVQADQVDLRADPHAPFCYRIEARFSWTFIVGVQGNASELAGHFPPLPGQEYGFDISVNDWDPGVSDPKARRESQLFWRSPGPNYQNTTSGFGPIRLSDSPLAVEQVPE